MPEEDELEKITDHFEHVLGRLNEAVDQIRELARIALSRSQKEELDLRKRLQEANVQRTDGEATLPCALLPGSRNPQFFGRDTELAALETTFNNQDPSNGLKSVNIFGMGGVGKSQVALHYALSHLDDFDAILWFHCESLKVAEESFSDAAMKFRFPDIKWNNHADNRWRVLSWLEQTRESTPFETAFH